MNILAVDDSALIRRIISEELQSGGYRVITADTGQEGLEIFKLLKPNLITLDVDMPEMNGFELCYRIRKLESLEKLEGVDRVPIVFITAMDNARDREKGFNAGASDFLVKPFKPGSLLRQVDGILNTVPLLQGVTAMVVDDSAIVRHMITNALTRQGVKVIEAGDGVEALFCLEKSMEEVDLVITDVKMPKMNGDQLCQEIRSIPGMEDIPVIMLSASNDSEAALKYFKIGATDYVPKPFSLEEIMARITVHLKVRMMNKELKKKNEDYQNDLALAREVQQAALKESVHADFLQINTHTQPFGEVGGDLFAFSKTEDEAVNIFIGDATGHGVAAALITMLTRSGLDSVDRNQAVSKVIAQLHDGLCGRSGDHYVTGIYVRVNARGELTYTNAGHPPLIIVPKQGKPRLYSEKGGLPLGMLDMPGDYDEETIILQPGDRFFIYTDGITEWENKVGEQYEMDRFLDFLETNRNKSLEDLKVCLLRELKQFSGQNPCNDDLTLLGFQFK